MLAVERAWPRPSPSITIRRNGALRAAIVLWLVAVGCSWRVGGSASPAPPAGAAVNVSTAGELLAALDSGVTAIRVTSSFTLETPAWRNLAPPVVVAAPLLIFSAAGESSSNDSAPYPVVDCAFLASKLRLSTTNITSSQLPFLTLRHLSLVNHLPPTGYGLLLLARSSTPGLIVQLEECLEERVVGEPLATVAAAAAALPPVAGQPPAAVQLASDQPWCPPGGPATACWPGGAVLYGSLAVEVTTGGGGSYLQLLDSVAYGVRQVPPPDCINAYGMEACIYTMQAELAAPPPVAPASKISAAAAAGVGVAATLGACLLLGACWLFVRRLRRGHRTLTMAVRPPGATPLTTLCVTDIMNSTNLWESLTTETMDESLRLHHRCLRGLLPKCNGYESATEGDSFILAFHTPLDAARFALMAQQALLELSWPAELLEHEDGCEVFAEPARPVGLGGKGGTRTSLGGILTGLSHSGGHTPYGHHNHYHFFGDDDSEDDADVTMYESGGPTNSAGGGGGWLSALSYGRSVTGRRPRPSMDRQSRPVFAAGGGAGVMLSRISFSTSRPPPNTPMHVALVAASGTGGGAAGGSAASGEVALSAVGTRPRSGLAPWHTHTGMSTVDAGLVSLPPAHSAPTVPAAPGLSATAMSGAETGAVSGCGSRRSLAGTGLRHSMPANGPSGDAGLAVRGADAAWCAAALPPEPPEPGDALRWARTSGGGGAADVAAPASPGAARASASPTWRGGEMGLLTVMGRTSVGDGRDTLPDLGPFAPSASGFGGGRRSSLGDGIGGFASVMQLPSASTDFHVIGRVGSGGPASGSRSPTMPSRAGSSGPSMYGRGGGGSTKAPSLPRTGPDGAWSFNPLAMEPLVRASGAAEGADASGRGGGGGPGAAVAAGRTSAAAQNGGDGGAPDASRTSAGSSLLTTPLLVLYGSNAGSRGGGGWPSGSNAGLRSGPGPVAEGVDDPVEFAAAVGANTAASLDVALCSVIRRNVSFGAHSSSTPVVPSRMGPRAAASRKAVALTATEEAAHGGDSDALFPRSGSESALRQSSRLSATTLSPSPGGALNGSPTLAAPGGRLLLANGSINSNGSGGFHARTGSSGLSDAAVQGGVHSWFGFTLSTGLARAAGGDGGGGVSQAAASTHQPPPQSTDDEPGPRSEPMLAMQQGPSGRSLRITKGLTGDLVPRAPPQPGPGGNAGGEATPAASGDGAHASDAMLAPPPPIAAAVSPVTMTGGSAPVRAHAHTHMGFGFVRPTPPHLHLHVPPHGPEMAGVEGLLDTPASASRPPLALSSPLRAALAAAGASNSPSVGRSGMHGGGGRGGTLSASRTQALDQVPLAAGAVKVPQVRETFRQLCAANWPLVSRAAVAAAAAAAIAAPPRPSFALSSGTPRPSFALHSSASFSHADAAAAGPASFGHTLEPCDEAGGQADGEGATGAGGADAAAQSPRMPSHHQHQLQQQMGRSGHSGTGRGGGGPTSAPSTRNLKHLVLLFRGFRVRIGLHTGVPLTTDVSFNHTTGHMAYSGLPLKVAKAVGDAAAGGSVLLSNSTFNAVHPHTPDLPGHPQALYCGDAQIELVVRSLYMLMPRELQPRLGHLAPLRNIRFVQRGNLEAPVGTVSICFMTVVGATKAVAELGRPAVVALQQVKSIVTRECCECGGYVVEATDGLCLAAFMEPAAAAIWALRCREALNRHPWSREVLASPHFREVRETVVRPARVRGQAPRRMVTSVMRGPRTRCGIATGPATAEVSSATARMAYRGKVMNRAARVAAQAADNTVLLSEAAWRRVVATAGLALLAAHHDGAALSQLLQRQATSGSLNRAVVAASSALYASAPAGGGPHGHTPLPSPSPQARGGGGGGGGSHAMGSGHAHAHASAGSTVGPGAHTPLRHAVSGGTSVAGPAAGGGLLMAAAEHLLAATVEEEGGELEEAEVLLASAAAVAATLPTLPQGRTLGAAHAGVFTLKGVAVPQELFELKLEAAPAGGGGLGHSPSGALEAAIPSGASTPHTLSNTASRAPSFLQSATPRMLSTNAHPGHPATATGGMGGPLSPPPSASTAAAAASRFSDGARTAPQLRLQQRFGGAGAGGASSGGGAGGQSGSPLANAAAAALAAATSSSRSGELEASLRNLATRVLAGQQSEGGVASPRALAPAAPSEREAVVQDLHEAQQRRDSKNEMHPLLGGGSREGSVLGLLDTAILEELRAAAGAPLGAGNGGDGSGAAMDSSLLLAARMSRGAESTAAAHSGASARERISAGRRDGVAGAKSPQKPLAGDALLEALVAEALA